MRRGLFVFHVSFRVTRNHEPRTSSAQGRPGVALRERCPRSRAGSDDRRRAARARRRPSLRAARSRRSWRRDPRASPGPCASMLRRSRLDGSGLIDTCGTGGDSLGTFNVSTLAGLVAAACGARVAKHGNRAVSSRCGSADLLEALGVRIDAPPAAVARGIEEAGFGFLFAPRYHPTLEAARASPSRAWLSVDLQSCGTAREPGAGDAPGGRCSGRGVPPTGGGGASRPSARPRLRGPWR